MRDLTIFNDCVKQNNKNNLGGKIDGALRNYRILPEGKLKHLEIFLGSKLVIQVKHFFMEVPMDSTAPFKMLGSVRSSHLPFEMHSVGYVRSDLPIIIHVGSIAMPFFIDKLAAQAFACPETAWLRNP